MLFSLTAGQLCAQDHTERLVVFVDGIRSERGQVVCFVWTGPAGFPRDTTKALRVVVAPIHRNSAVCRLSIPFGTYAVSGFHDENLNGRLDHNVLGLPVEGHLVSNDADRGFGPPRYADPAFRYNSNAVQIRLKMKY
ncbi:DUF2141 domain-containing protein [Tunturibacter empetritectus]|uniref:DUF2141 domain-containing protein n=1 Tax=Tunturiibacter empetritectus TaxID=3069691 RepID=UPI0015CDDF39